MALHASITTYRDKLRSPTVTSDEIAPLSNLSQGRLLTVLRTFCDQRSKIKERVRSSHTTMRLRDAAKIRTAHGKWRCISEECKHNPHASLPITTPHHAPSLQTARKHQNPPSHHTHHTSSHPRARLPRLSHLPPPHLLLAHLTRPTKYATPKSQSQSTHSCPAHPYLTKHRAPTRDRYTR
jgi:hypothetical protein